MLQTHPNPATGVFDLNALASYIDACFDRAFFSMMIPHRQSAVDMSRAALPRLRDPLVRAWAQSIIDDQQKESAKMQADEMHDFKDWLRTHR